MNYYGFKYGGLTVEERLLKHVGEAARKANLQLTLSRQEPTHRFQIETKIMPQLQQEQLDYIELTMHPEQHGFTVGVYPTGVIFSKIAHEGMISTKYSRFSEMHDPREIVTSKVFRSTEERETVCRIITESFNEISEGAI